MNTNNILVDRFYAENSDKKTLSLMIAGSHFFNLNSVKSDINYKGIYLPTDGIESKKGEITYKTNTKKNVKNSSEDIDCTFYSLKKFLKLLCAGDFNMIEMLFAPRDKIIVTSDIYEDLRFINKSLIPTDISSFLGFIKREYNRYGVDKNHYAIISNFLHFLKTLKRNFIYDRLKDHWPEIVKYAEKSGSYIKIGSTWNENKELPVIIIAKRVFQNTVKIEYLIDTIKHILGQYGHRRISRAKDGVEFKGLYHVMRLIYEDEDLLTTGELHFPFPTEKHAFLRSIKDGQVDPNALFDSINCGLERLYELEKGTISNQKIINYITDKIIWKYYGRLEIEHIMAVANGKQLSIPSI